MTELVFVYGTLKKGYGNHRVMEKAGGVLVEPEARTEPYYSMVNLGSFPGVVAHGKTAIKGEVYKVEELQWLDYLEGYPSFYNRVQVPITVGPTTHVCWMYTLSDLYLDQNPLIADGVWK